jgi:hypothetical protein
MRNDLAGRRVEQPVADPRPLAPVPIAERGAVSMRLDERRETDSITLI